MTLPPFVSVTKATANLATTAYRLMTALPVLNAMEAGALFLHAPLKWVLLKVRHVVGMMKIHFIQLQ